MNRLITTVRSGVWMVALMVAVLGCSLPGVPSVETTSQPEQPGGPESGAGKLPVSAEPSALKPLVSVPGGATIKLLTPSEGAGVKPLLAWEPVDGAVFYGLVIYDADGGAYWSWQGSETSIYLGGTRDAPPENSAGPVLGPEMSWGVMAFDAGGRLVASSALTPIAP